MRIYTIGHGDRSAGEFRHVLLDAGVRCLVDVRAHPGSRRHPQFSRSTLEHDLAASGIRYGWQGEALGGRRRPRPESPNIAWRNASFRAYADHMGSAEFGAAVDELIDAALQCPTALMCAERLPWQCHRQLIADFLVVRGIEVVHLLAPGSARVHILNPAARVDGDVIVYDRTVQMGLDLGD